MPRKPTEDLTELIHSMSRVEKIQFQQYLQKRTEEPTLALLLFTSIMKEKDENNNDKGTTPIPSNRLAATKSVLYYHILHFLREFHSTKNDAEVYDLIFNARLLMHKRLLAQAEKMLKRARKIAEKEELFPALLQVLDLEYHLHLDRQLDLSWMKKELANNLSEEKRTADKILEMAEFKLLSSQLSAFHNKFYYVKNKAQDAIIKKFEESAILKRVPLSKSSKMMRQYVDYSFKVKRNDPAGALSSLQKSFWENEKDAELPNRFQENQLHIAYNILVLAIEFLSYKEAEQYLERIKVIPHDLLIDTEHFKNYYFYGRLKLKLRYGKISQGIAEDIPEFNKWISDEDEQISPNLIASTIYMSGIFHFLAGDIKGAMHWHRKILLAKDLNREFIFRLARIMNIIFFIEKGDLDEIPNLVRSCEREFLKNNILHEGEKYLLGYFKHHFADVNPDKKVELKKFQVLREELSKMPKKYVENGLLYRNIDVWLESRYTGKKMLHLIQERVKDQSWKIQP